MNIKKYLFETIKYALRSYPIIRPYIKEVDRLYTMNAEELKQRNEKRFLEIFRKAYDKSPFYYKLYTERGIRKEDITCLEDIKKLPVITKDMVKKHADEMLTVPRWQVIRANTSGTTGTPLKIYESWPSIWWTQAYTYCSRKRDGFTYGQPLVSLRGHLNRNQTSLKIHLSNTLFLSSYNINSNTVEQYYKKIVMFQPIAIEGYPSSLYSLALFLKDAELELSIPITFTSSETLLDYQRDLIEERLGTEIYDRYGMTERTIFLVESHNHAGYYEAPGFSINEYIDDGEICTSLINDAFPMIRYRSNDIMEIEEATDENPQIVVKRVNGPERNAPDFYLLPDCFQNPTGKKCFQIQHHIQLQKGSPISPSKAEADHTCRKQQQQYDRDHLDSNNSFCHRHSHFCTNIQKQHAYPRFSTGSHCSKCRTGHDLSPAQRYLKNFTKTP